jgi:hypothetical protein
MVIDGSAKVFQFAPRRGVSRSLRNILAAEGSINCRQGFVAEKAD